MQKKKYLGLIVLCALSQFAFSQGKDTTNQKIDPFINTVEQTLNLFYADHANQSNYDSIISLLHYEPGQIPHFTDDQYCERLSKMNEMSPFHLDCTPAALATIKFFAEKRRSFARVVLGRSALYFEMFEEKLAEYDLPLELKYLAVIESGLRPQVKSRAGALGLWQFMYRTGLYYGLNENSYIDERMDPELATDAACRYLKKLYGIYDDWNLALASYNAGPGNVNKAIRRSGGKKTYWEVRPFLPSETQGYVPNFIAAAYLLTYHAEHNIIPMEAKWNYAQLDTICLKSGIHMSSISKVTGWDLEEIKTLNPVYKSSYIPLTSPCQCISGPLQEIGKIVSLENELYAAEKRIYSPGEAGEDLIVADEDLNGSEGSLVVSGDKTPAVGTTTITYANHTVRRGEGLGIIATKYGVTVNDIVTANKLKSTVLYAGQKLKIPQKGHSSAPVSGEQVASETTATQAKISEPVKPKTPAKKYYTVRSGDTGSKIAQKHNLTQQQLRALNGGANLNRILVGQKLRVK
jgi:membrane-bound lytic murein transglycosylase D